jgi:hypothetical protein
VEEPEPDSFLADLDLSTQGSSLTAAAANGVPFCDT